eukprot:jgi/Astpho2/6688/e_gw1.00101.127.1_t
MLTTMPTHLGSCLHWSLSWRRGASLCSTMRWASRRKTSAPCAMWGALPRSRRWDTLARRALGSSLSSRSQTPPRSTRAASMSHLTWAATARWATSCLPG